MDALWEKTLRVKSNCNSAISIKCGSSPAENDFHLQDQSLTLKVDPTLIIQESENVDSYSPSQKMEEKHGAVPFTITEMAENPFFILSGAQYTCKP